MFNKTVTLVLILALASWAPLASAQQIKQANQAYAEAQERLFDQCKKEFLKDFEMLAQQERSFYQRHKKKIWGIGITTGLIGAAVVFTVVTGGLGAPSVPTAVGLSTVGRIGATAAVAGTGGSTLATGAAFVQGTIISASVFSLMMPSANRSFDVQKVKAQIEKEINSQRSVVLATCTTRNDMARKMNTIAKEVLEKY